MEVPYFFILILLTSGRTSRQSPPGLSIVWHSPNTATGITAFSSSFIRALNSLKFAVRHTSGQGKTIIRALSVQVDKNVL